jgi:hypothetical protein
MSERQNTAIAITALVVAVLGWTPVGEATRTAVFPANSVGTAQLKANSVTSAKIRDRAVAGTDIQRRTIGNAHIAPGSLLASSFRPGVIPRGGLSEFEIVRADTAYDTVPLKSLVINCPTGKKVTGGGGAVQSRDRDAAGLTTTGPWDDKAWSVGATAFPGTVRVWGIAGFAICAKAG